MLYSDIHNLTNPVWNMEELPEQEKKSVTPTHNKDHNTVCSNY
jgi:hypothetical protein